MKMSGTCDFVETKYSYGTVIELPKEHQVTNDCIIPESIGIICNSKRWQPTRYDWHGNFQIGGITRLMLLMEIYHLVCAGALDSKSARRIRYSFETAGDEKMILPVSQRIQQKSFCPVCGKSFVVSNPEASKMPEDVTVLILKEPGDKRPNRHTNREFVHQGCDKKFHRLQKIYDATRAVEQAFCSDDVDERFHFRWGEGEQKMHYESFYNVSFSHCPWLEFRTPIGNFNIGWRDDVITIVFLDNFIPFDLAIFDGAQTTRYLEVDGTKVIHASSIEKVSEYLARVHKAVFNCTY